MESFVLILRAVAEFYFWVILPTRHGTVSLEKDFPTAAGLLLSVFLGTISAAVSLLLWPGPVLRLEPSAWLSLLFLPLGIVWILLVLMKLQKCKVTVSRFAGWLAFVWVLTSLRYLTIIRFLG